MGNGGRGKPGKPVRYESAVHVSGGPKIVDGTNGASGVPLVETGNRTTGSEDWAHYFANNPTLIPEPGVMAILGLG
jgi:hypothetical protein